MSEPYTWTTDAMREEYIWRNRPRPSEESAAEFDTWLDQVRAEAWDEGYTIGNRHNGRRDANPYRKVEQ